MLVDVVIVSFNSEAQIRECVIDLVDLPDVSVTVVDNASTDASVPTIADLDVRVVPLAQNVGFAAASNIGWRLGVAPYVLLLNPDARIDAASLRTLVRHADERTDVGAVGPKILESDGSVALSQRRFQRLGSTYSQALFLHRVFSRSSWANELVTDSELYDRPNSPEWLSGAVLLVRRSALEELGGLDEGFFLYSEDEDLCRRMRQLGYDVVYEPRATARHQGGASAPRAALLPVLAESRARYAEKHHSRIFAAFERVGLALEAASHLVICKGGLPVRRGHARAFSRLARRSSFEPKPHRVEEVHR